MRLQVIAVAVVACLWSSGALAQEQPVEPPAQPKPAPSTQRSGPVPLKVTLVISRHQGEKKISSLPYSFGVTTGERTLVTMGSEIPVLTTSFKSGDGSPQQSFNYRSVGTHITCNASMLDSGLFKLWVGIDDSSLHVEEGQSGSPVIPSPQRAVARDAPSFRSFKVNFVTLLRDGQSTQHTSATDPVTGEVMRVDVTLNVLK